MARTAPVPNIPPIPGMCPSIAVMGGGAGGAGGGGDGAGDGDGQNGADGSGSGDGANGDGSGAGSCGTGSPGSCTGCGNTMSVGDPIDVGSGRVFTPTTVDVAFPGPLPLAFTRQYNSGCKKRDVGLGWGWVHTFGWSVVEHRDHVVLWDNLGNSTRFGLPELGQAIVGPEGKLLARTETGYALELGGFWRLFVSSDARDGTYRLSAVVDDNGNRIQVHYRGNGLRYLVDSVGRVVDVDCDETGRIRVIRARNADVRGQMITYAQFAYDDEGCLASVIDGEGHLTSFTYNADHSLATLDRPQTDAIFHFRYDDSGRCVESWGAPKGQDFAGLSRSVSPTLADGITRAKGLMHVVLTYGTAGFVEVIDSVSVRRYFANERGLIEKGISGGSVFTRKFDHNGNLIEYADALGATYRYTRDERGFIVRAVDPLGNETRTLRDAKGRPLQMTDALGTIMTVVYDPRGNVQSLTMSAGDTYSFEHDARGLVVREHRPDGSTLRFGYDAHGNLTSLQMPDGSVYRWAYDPIGNMISEVDANGKITSRAWDSKRRPISLTRPDGGSTRFEYDAADNLTAITEGGRVSRARYSALGKTVEQSHPDGSVWAYLYDREGRLLETVNEKQERRTLELDLNGGVRGISSFDGRVERFKLDAMERLVEYVDGNKQRTVFKRDARGQVTDVEYPDGKTAAFGFDCRGQLVSAKNDAVELRYDLAPFGKPLREQQTVGGEQVSVEFQYDVMRRRIHAASSSGYQVDVERDIMGRWTQLTTGGAVLSTHRYDPAGHEIERQLPGGAVLQSAHTEIGDLTLRQLFRPGGAPVAGEPDLLGPLAKSRAIVEKRFSYLSNTWLASRSDSRLGSVEYSYDLRGRLLTARGDHKVESFAYDAAGNTLVSGTPRSYGPGNRIVRSGDVDYQSDAHGRIVAKVRRLPDGTTQRTTYAWNGAGNLKSVSLPDGRRVELDYDPFARRMRKRVYAHDAQRGKPRLEKDVRYLWNGAQIAQEIVRQAASSGDAVVWSKTYVYDPSGAPLAQVESRDGTERVAYYVTDHAGTPEQLVDSSGRVLGELTRDAWGLTTQKQIDATVSEETATTPHRFRGQWEDEESGLFYNRYRYYDPETGRYISPDPSAGLPDMNEFRYGASPINDVDPFGLQHNATATWHPPPGGGPPVPLGNNGNLESGFDAPNARGDMMNPNCTTNAGDYNARANRGTTNGGAPESAAQGRSRAELMAQNRERFSDTEAQAIREVERAVPNQADRAGGRLEIQGELPPCQMCRSRMQDFARRNNCTVEYRYPLGNNPTGLFRSDRGNSTWSENGARVQAVAGASHSSYPTPVVPPGGPRPPGYREIADADANLPIPRPDASQ